MTRIISGSGESEGRGNLPKEGTSASDNEQLLVIKKASSALLEPEAHARLMFIVQTHADGMQTAQQILQLAQRRVLQTGRKLTEEELIRLLQLLKGSRKHEGRITIHRK